MAVSRSLASRPKLLTATAPEDTPDDVDDDEIDADEQAATERARNARRPRPSTSSSTSPKPAAKAPAKKAPAKKSSTSSSSSKAPAAVSGAAHDGAGVLLGLVTYALFLAYVKGGWAGVRQWLAAKFLNKTNAAPATPPAQQLTPQNTPHPKTPFIVPQGPVGGVGGLYSP